MNSNLHDASRFYFDVMLRNGVPSEETREQAKAVFNSLLKIEDYAIMTELTRQKEEVSFSSAEIPQYSSLFDCFLLVDKLIRSGLNGISYSQAGFLLRISQRKRDTDCKYGKNHAKCASLMGLCLVENGKVWRNSFTYAHEMLDDSIKESLMPKLCRGIKVIRGYFQHNESDIFIHNAMSCLSESTQKRRSHNIIRLINVVKESII